MRIPQLIDKTLTVGDGTRIAYQIRGDGPAVVFANGLGANYVAWRNQFSMLEAERYKLLCWDYRGLFGSSRPADLSTLAIERQVADLRDLMDHEGIPAAVIVGWSLGVQVAFEFYRQHPRRVLGIAALSGIAGRPLDAVRGGALIKHAVPAALVSGRYLAPVWAPIVSSAARWPSLVPKMAKLGLCAETMDRTVFSSIVQRFTALDFDVYARTFRFMSEHDARDVLADVAVPTSVICGTRDPFVSLDVARTMSAAISAAELTEIEGGTHYAAVEHPHPVNEALARLLRKAQH
jgi:pimeloyl-ACP methyl ester carboxylesterase